MFIPSKMKRILLTVCAALLATSCMMDKKPGVTAGSGEGKVAVTFAVEVPAAVPVQTRAAYGDCDVLNMDVLVFDQDGKFLERVGTDLVSGDGAAKSFTVRVDPSASRRTFIVIANARTASGADRVDMTALTPGMSETDVLTALKTVPLAGGRADEILPLVMYGHGELPKVDDAAGPLGVSLLRAVACIQVKTAMPTSDNGLADFTVLRGTLSGAAGCGLVAPGAGAGPNEPSGLTYVDYWTSEADDAGWSVGSNPVLYAYERRNTPADYMSLLVKASWKGRECYYRLLMQDAGGTPYDIVRNHRYTVLIVQVEGPGWGTAAQAMANAPANDIVRIQITDAADDIFDIVADGQYMLGLTCNSLERWGGTGSGNVSISRFLRATHPSAESLLEADVDFGRPVLSDISFVPSSGSTDGFFDVRYRREIMGLDTEGAITFRCGNLERQVEVRFWESKFLTGYADKDADSYAFLLADETTPKPWRVWIPSSKALRLSPSASAADFTPGSGIDNSGWGASLMESRTSAKVYLHIPIGPNSCLDDDIMFTDGNGLVRRITIGGHN